jgi:hypothetical protein
MTLGVGIAAAAAAADDSGNYVVAPFAGVVSAAEIVAATALTGANTDSRTFQLHNRGQAGSGTALVASKAFVLGVNAAADDATALTLSATAADLVVAQGDILEFTSLHVGSTGLAGPKALGRVTFSRTAGS